MFENFSNVVTDLYNKLMDIPMAYEHAVNAQFMALAKRNKAETDHELLRSNVSIRIAQEGETLGKKYSLDRIKQGVDVDPEVVKSEQGVLAAKIIYEEMVAKVKVIENRQKICHDMVSLVGTVPPFTHRAESSWANK